ncbi:hypothetical protein AB0J38_17215 [Streptomyces sp. NPDC050095]|uniref:Acb2/Tad1 domain-containing protein n=1 Tax=unclassified Streptomyces TaxID=2593676 RepID=UPI003425AF05
MTYHEISQRFDPHLPRCAETADLHATVRAEFRRLGRELSERLPEGREFSQVLTKLEEASYWAHSAIARGCCLCAQPTQPPHTC